MSSVTQTVPAACAATTGIGATETEEVIDAEAPHRRQRLRRQVSFAVTIELDLPGGEMLVVPSTTTLVSSMGATLVVNCPPEDFRLFMSGQAVRLSIAVAGTLAAEVNGAWTDPKDAPLEAEGVRFLIGVRLTSGTGWRPEA